MPRKKQAEPVPEPVPEPEAEQPALLTALNEIGYQDMVLPASAFPPDSKILSPAPNAAFISNIRRRTIINRVLCYRLDDNSIYIMAGKRRVKAARHIDPEYPIPTRMYAAMPKWDALTIESADNANRSPNGLSDLHVLMQLAAAGQPLALSMLPKGTIRKTMKIVSLEPAFIEAITSGHLAMATAAALARLTAKEREPFLELLADGEKITAGAVAQCHWAKAKASAATLGATPALLPSAYDAGNLYLVLEQDLGWAQHNVKRALKGRTEAEEMAVHVHGARIFKLVEVE